MISILYKRGENIGVILHFYGARAIFLLFFDQQNIEYESREMEIGVARPILTHKKSKSIWYNGIHNLQYGEK